MPATTRIPLLAAALAVLWTSAPAHACSWAAFASGNVAIVARTMDWEYNDNAVVKGHGRNSREKTADTPDAIDYAAKYASIRIHSFDAGLVSDAMNEKGLQAACLFLDESELPAPRPGRKDVDPNNFLAYAVANFATVREVVAALADINFIPAALPIPAAADGTPIDYPPEKWPVHFAFADAGGDRAVVEFVRGEMKIYHGPGHDALTNEPFYEIHLALDDLEYAPTGSIYPVDRRARAKNYLRDMRERGVETHGRALLAMRGLLATVSAGTEEIDRAENEVYPTIWGVLADQTEKRYYLTRIDSWCAEIYDFSLFPYTTPGVTLLRAEECPYGGISGK